MFRHERDLKCNNKNVFMIKKKDKQKHTAHLIKLESDYQQALFILGFHVKEAELLIMRDITRTLNEVLHMMTWSGDTCWKF